MFLADHAAVDAGKKINALGIGFSVVGADLATGLTGPQTVVALIEVPPTFYDVDYVVTLTLRGPDDTPVTLPGPVGQPQAVRMTQTLRAETPVFDPSFNVPRQTVWAHSQVLVNLSNGLPLPLGNLYTWTLELDDTRRDEWAVGFYVPGPRPGPVFGGPANPANIPGIAG